MFLEVGVMLEGQVPIPYPRTGVRTLLAQASPVPFSGRAWGPPRASNQCHLAHGGGVQWRRTSGASSAGRCHELACLDAGIGKGFLQRRLARSSALSIHCNKWPWTCRIVTCALATQGCCRTPTCTVAGPLCGDCCLLLARDSQPCGGRAVLGAYLGGSMWQGLLGLGGGGGAQTVAPALVH